MKRAPRWEAILLAAGASSRMGRPKALLPWSGRSLLEHQVLELLATRVRRVVVVLGAHSERLLPLLAGGVRTLGGRLECGGPRLSWVVNRDWPRGKCFSIRCGAEAVSPGADHLLLAAVDQPLAAEVLEVLLSAHERSGRLVTLPSFRGRRGHPVALSRRLTGELKQLSEEREGLRSLVRDAERRGDLHTVEIAAPSVLWNLNRPEEVPRAERGGAQKTEVLRWGTEGTSP